MAPDVEDEGAGDDEIHGHRHLWQRKNGGREVATANKSVQYIYIYDTPVNSQGLPVVCMRRCRLVGVVAWVYIVYTRTQNRDQYRRRLGASSCEYPSQGAHLNYSSRSTLAMAPVEVLSAYVTRSYVTTVFTAVLASRAQSPLPKTAYSAGACEYQPAVGDTHEACEDRTHEQRRTTGLCTRQKKTQRGSKHRRSSSIHQEWHNTP